MDNQFEEIVERETCLFYRTYYDVAKALPEDKKLPYIMNILSFFFEETPLGDTGDPLIDIALLSIKKVVEANEKNFWNGKKGGAPKGNRNAVKNNSKTTENNLETIKNNLKQPKTTKTTPLVLENNGEQPNEKGERRNDKGENNNEKVKMRNGDGCFSSSSSQEIVVEAINDVNKYPEMLRGSEYRDVRGNYEDVIWLEDVQDKSDDYWNSFDVHVKIDGFWSIERFIQYLSRHHSCSMFSIPGSFPDGLRNRIKAEVNKYCPSMGYIED